MVRVFENSRPASTALPSGGPTDNGVPNAGKTVDKPTSSFDRRRHHIIRKDREPSKIFVPLNPNEVPTNPNRGKGLHTDPFGMDREVVEMRRTKVKVATPRGPVRPERRHVKSAPGPQPVKKPGFICSTGVQHFSPKRVPKEKHMTTHEREQPPKTFTGNRRFLSSPDKQGPLSPSRSMGGSDTQMSLNSPPRAVSQVFPGDCTAPLALSSSVERPKGLRVNPSHARQGTLEGVWGPMPGGRAPKPSSLAPWMQESAVPTTGRALTARPSRPAAAPYAIEA